MTQEVVDTAADAQDGGASLTSDARGTPSCAELITLAERELAAFVGAVSELFGSEQARLSAEDWLDSLVSMVNLPGPTLRDWRQVTVVVAERLASRLSTSSSQMQPVIPAHSNSCSDESIHDRQVSCTDTVEAAQGEKPWQL